MFDYRRVWENAGWWMEVEGWRTRRCHHGLCEWKTVLAHWSWQTSSDSTCGLTFDSCRSRCYNKFETFLLNHAKATYQPAQKSPWYRRYRWLDTATFCIDWETYLCSERREFSGMIHNRHHIRNFIIPATPSNPSVPYVKRTSKENTEENTAVPFFGTAPGLLFPGLCRCWPWLGRIEIHSHIILQEFGIGNYCKYIYSTYGIYICMSIYLWVCIWIYVYVAFDMKEQGYLPSL